jgi:hypothetical protein
VLLPAAFAVVLRPTPHLVHLKRSLANLVKQGITQLTMLRKTRIRRM